MFPQTLRNRLRDTLPAPLRTIGRRVENYIRRCTAIGHTAHGIRGYSLADKVQTAKSLLAAPVLMLNGLDQWREPYLLGDATVMSQCVGLFRVRRRSDDLAHILYVNNRSLFEVMRSVVKQGDVVIDAGANIGAMTVFLAQLVGADGQVVAIEMMPDTADSLRHNVDLNGLTCVSVVQRALSDSSGELVSARVADGYFGQASISISVPSDALMAKKAIQVVTTTLDTVTCDFGEVALIKMDLEGVELQALKGAEQLLLRTRHILFERWQDNVDPVGEFLNARGFRLKNIDGRNCLAIRDRLGSPAS